MALLRARRLHFWTALLLAPVGESLELTDYDCRRVPDGVVAWSTWRAALVESAGNWLRSSREVLAQLGDEQRDRAMEECPLGMLMADILRMLACFDRQDACSAKFEPVVREGLSHFGLRILMGTTWPIYQALHSDVWERLPGATNPKLTCEETDSMSILNWSYFKRLFDQEEDWYQPAVDVAYGPELAQQWRSAALECPLGFAAANLIKAMLCSHTESICFRAHEQMMGAVLEEIPLPDVAASGWPIIRLLGHVSRVVRRHGFDLDFLPGELLKYPEAEVSRSMQDLHVALPPLRRAADATAARWKGLRLVYASMAHGPRFSPYVSRFMGRAAAVGIGSSLLLFCLDDEALQECQSVPSGHCVRGRPSILNKFTLPLVLLHEHFDVFWLDLDVFLFQSPTPFVARTLQREPTAELLVSGAFAADCICSGVVLFRATEQVSLWLKNLLIWMYEHPYEHDQKAFSALLRSGERVAFEQELPLQPSQLPNWLFLDPETRFVSARHVDVAGWYGDPDEIVAFHMLHGDSDTADASRQWAQRNAMGSGYVPLLDLFFNQTTFPELYTTPLRPHRLDVLRDALERSRWPHPRPSVRPRCNETVPMSY